MATVQSITLDLDRSKATMELVSDLYALADRGGMIAEHELVGALEKWGANLDVARDDGMATLIKTLKHQRNVIDRLRGRYAG